MASNRTTNPAGLGMFLAGLVTYVLSSWVVTDGFVHGMLQGMTIALMAGAAYVLGAQWRHGRHGDRDAEHPDTWWLPSRDDRRG